MDLSPQMFRDIPKLVSHHYKEGNINWPMGIYISLVHIVAVVGIFRLTECSKETLMWAFLLWPIRYVWKWDPASVEHNAPIVLSSVLTLVVSVVVSFFYLSFNQIITVALVLQ
jgi:uncharacterized membrane protein YfcA